jgi:hypothetical protein
MKVYVATHCRNDEELNSRKIIGIFSSQVNAHAVIDSLAEEIEAEDADYPDLFQVDAYDLDEALLVQTS